MNPNVWFTADTHFYHRNICKFSNRPFNSVEEMNEVLIANHNSVVGEHDTVYHLGDFCFGGREKKLEMLGRLNGCFHCIAGNHDSGLEKAIESKYTIGKGGAGKVQFFGDAKLISVNKQSIYLLHYACRVWPNAHRGTWMLFGHSHGNLSDLKGSRSVTDALGCVGVEEVLLKSMDVGVDTDTNGHKKYFPYSFEEIKTIMDKRGFAAQDHHTTEEE
jgi:calcineurin-like phosphoesterase family protein